MTRDPGRGEQLDAVLELVPCGVVMLTEKGEVTAWNDAVETILGWSADDVIGRDAVEFAIPEARQEAARTGLARLRRDRMWKGNLLLNRRGGGSVLCAARAQALSDGSVIVTLVELHDRKAPDDERPSFLRAERAARAELERVRDRLAFVVHASSRLASSLDVGMTLETAGDLLLPRFGRLCVIDLWDGRRLERVFIKGYEQSGSDLVGRLRSLSGKQREEHPALQAVRTGRPAVIPHTDRQVAKQMYEDPAHQDLVLEVTQGAGFVAVPLLTRGRVIGVLTLLGSAEDSAGRPSTQADDLAVLEQVASRVAQSIENARLFDAERRLARSLQESERRQRQAALTLQRSLLPPWTHQPEELEVASRYFPGAEETEVGGDWYDVIPVGTGRTALVIGDVMGRGLRAATFMGQVRTAIRAYSHQDLSPKEMLQLLDAVVHELGEAEIVTVVYAVYDAARNVLTYASAGHLPLLLVDRTGRSRRLDHESGLPLGVGSCAAPEHTVEIEPGALVALYTDGLVEDRQRDVDTGIDRLLATLSRASGSLEGLCDTIIDELRPPGGYEDDVGLLLARARTPEEARSGSGITVTVPFDLSAAPFARSRVEQALQQWGTDGELADNVVLTAAELVSNALRHGAPPVQLQLRRLPRTIVVECHDASSAAPRVGSPGPNDYDGLRRGLQLVRLLSSRWGWRRTERGKTVWCEHDLP